jgi:hypothetical protein
MGLGKKWLTYASVAMLIAMVVYVWNNERMRDTEYRAGTSPPATVEMEPTAEEQALLEKVEVSYEVQYQFDDQGRQKAVIWVKNNTARVLAGAELDVTIVTWDGMSGNVRLFQSTKQETFTIAQLQPGLQTWGVMWIKPQPSSEMRYSWRDAEFQ